MGETRGIAASSDVPDENRQWLQDLFTRAAHMPEFQEQSKQVSGLQVRILGSKETRNIAQSAYDKTLPIMRDLGANELGHEQDQSPVT
jgi:tripartite-type tricarboxylate transporter receptor subunit TctC